ncbi:MAG: PilZ domain-containing protein [Bryobacteraceae bacterium]|nr:PilZ domain-containing protein [Bryobacteraceae bacterium]
MSEKRRTKRYELQLPVEVIRVSGQPARWSLVSINISSRGVLVMDPEERLRRGQAVEFLIRLPTGSNGIEVLVHCLGNVVRCDAARKAAALTLQRYEFLRSPASAAAAAGR